MTQDGIPHKALRLALKGAKGRFSKKIVFSFFSICSVQYGGRVISIDSAIFLGNSPYLGRVERFSNHYLAYQAVVGSGCLLLVVPFLLLPQQNVRNLVCVGVGF